LFVPVVTENTSSSSESEYDIISSDEEWDDNSHRNREDSTGADKKFEVEKVSQYLTPLFVYSYVLLGDP